LKGIFYQSDAIKIFFGLFYHFLFDKNRKAFIIITKKKDALGRLGGFYEH
jgi:hypothetical protein